MKTILVTAFMAVCMVCGASAQNNTERPCRDNKCDKMTQMTPEQMAERRTEKLTRELSLTDAQARQVYQLNLKDAQSAVQHRKEADARREQMMAKWKTYQAERDAQMKKVLTPEQYTKWSEMQLKKRDCPRGHFKGHKWQRGEGRMQECCGQAGGERPNRRNR